MAHYLHRSFHDDPETHVLHGLRLEDREQPEQDGSPGVCQIDHLVGASLGDVHRREQDRCRICGTSPVQSTRVFLNGSACTRAGRRECPPRSSKHGANRTSSDQSWNGYLGMKSWGGIRSGCAPSANIVSGKAPFFGGFLDARIQLMIAISDRGRIDRLGGRKASLSSRSRCSSPRPIWSRTEIDQRAGTPSQGRDVAGLLAGRVRSVGQSRNVQRRQWPSL